MTDRSERELDALMTDLADGDRSAFDPLFAALHPRAVALARMRLDPGEVEDAAQQTLAQLFARAGEFTPGRAVLPWFYAIAANEIHRVKRRRARARSRETAVDAADALPAIGDPEAALVREELRASVRRAIAELDDASAEAVRAMLDEVGPPRDVAPAAFRKRMSRAYSRLRALLGGRS